MAEIEETAELHAPPPEVWAVVGDFAAFGDWHPAGIAATVENRAEGTIRTVTIAGGERLIDRLVSIDPATMTISYSWVEGALPVRSLETTLSVTPSEEGSTVTWRARFEPAGDEAKAADVVEALVSSGLQGLKKRFP